MRASMTTRSLPAHMEMSPAQVQVAEAVTSLFVPGDRSERFVKAMAAGAGGVDVAILRVTSAWRPDRRAEAAAVLGTTDPTHPGVHALLHESHPWYVSGPLEVLHLPTHHAFRGLRHTPAEVRSVALDFMCTIFTLSSICVPV